MAKVRVNIGEGKSYIQDSSIEDLTDTECSIDVIQEINKKTESFKGMQVPVKVIIDTDTKEFEITVGTPPAQLCFGLYAANALVRKADSLASSLLP